MRALWVTMAVLCAGAGGLALPARKETKTRPTRAACGYQSCPTGKPGKLNVHLIAHTHDDVGWLKTVDQYYYGGRNGIQNAGVQYIIDSVVDELLHDASKRFIYVETSFFWKWWQEQDEKKRSQVRGLVDSGQLEFIGGAWSMNDEAVTHYQSIIDQFTWGFRILNDTLGECAAPRIGWQIDPFGHSREMASLLAQMGMDGLFFGRLDYQDKTKRLADKSMEMIWQGSPENLGASSDIFTHAMYNTYFSPPGFCFDIFCNDEPIVDNPRSVMYNIPRRVAEFESFLREQAKSFKTKHLLVTVGGDFHYQDALAWFKNLDKLISYTNKLQETGGELNLFYSTPSCYLKAANEADETWPTKQDDFFPYGSDEQSYWTGYFTSKPTIKYFERLGNNFLQVSKQLTALTGKTMEDVSGVTELREAMGILQHHDAITGTMKAHVAHDYARILWEAIQKASKNAGTALNSLFHDSSFVDNQVESCLLLNTSQCSSERTENFVVTVYNPLSRPVTQYVRLPVTMTSYLIQDSKESEVPYQIVPLPSWVKSLPGRLSGATDEMVFKAQDLPPVGYQSYYISRTQKPFRRHHPLPSRHTKASSISNQFITLNLDDSGRIQSVVMNGVDSPLTQSFGYYKGYYSAGERASGAYIFRPNGSEPVDLPITDAWVVQGELVQEVHQLYAGGWVAQVVRLYKDENHVEFEWQVGPIPDEDGIGKEVITRYQTGLDSNTYFYTDSNGREMLKRERNFRPTWDLDVTEPVASNYYPVTSKIMIRDEIKGQEAAVFVDRAQGGTSLASGQMELMLHRRLFHDDDKGVNEPLNEKAFGTGLVVRGKHYFTVGPIQGLTPSFAAQQRLLAHSKLAQPWAFLSPADDISYPSWMTSYVMQFSGLRTSLPDNVHLLTLEPWKEGSCLVRLEHIMEKGDDEQLSARAVVNLHNLFKQYTVVSARETTLGGNKFLEDVTRLAWKSEGGSTTARTHSKRALDLTAVTLDPMQIRTFIVDVRPRGRAHVIRV